MQKTVRFFKLDNGWYADVPGHTLEENEMVAGADVVLEEIDHSMYDSGVVFLTLSYTFDESSACKPFLLKFTRKSHDRNGAVYTLSGPLAVQHDAVGCEVWICNVTHDVLGEHPKSIYVLDIK